MDKKIFTEVKDHIGIIWLNRPEKKNALNDELWFGLPDLVKELDDNDEVRVIVFAAKGDTFSSGIDINTLVNAFELTEEAKTTELKTNSAMATLIISKLLPEYVNEVYIPSSKSKLLSLSTTRCCLCISGFYGN